jgi:hypothetical protein
MALLETALQIADLGIEPRNTIRFAFWGAEEAGPAGSDNIERLFEDYFASQGLASEPTAFDDRSDYDAFINAGIPAGGLFTGAEDAKTVDQVPLYGGLAEFNGQPVAYDPCYHQPCDSMDPIQDGADAGLYTALNAAYGGALEYNGVITNVNLTGLEEMSDAVAHAILTYAMSRSSVSGTDKASPVAAEKVGDRLGAHLMR